MSFILIVTYAECRYTECRGAHFITTFCTQHPNLTPLYYSVLGYKKNLQCCNKLVRLSIDSEQSITGGVSLEQCDSGFQVQRH